MKVSPRSRKLAGVLQEQLPVILAKHTTPNQVGIATITAVEVSGDLGVAEVYMRTIGAPSDWLEYLQKMKGRLSTELAKVVAVRRKIELRFKRDNSLEQVNKINQLT